MALNSGLAAALARARVPSPAKAVPSPAKAPEKALPPPPADDRGLVEGLVQGRTDAWGALVDRYGGLIYHVIGRTLQSHRVAFAAEDVEDIFNETLLALVDRDYRLLRMFRPQYPLKSWLAVITRTYCHRFLRTRRLNALSIERDGGNDDGRSALKEILGAWSPPAGRLEERETFEKVDRLLRLLPPKIQVIIRLFYFQEKSYREIARALGMSVNAVAVTIYRVRERLREALLKAEGRAANAAGAARLRTGPPAAV